MSKFYAGFIVALWLLILSIGASAETDRAASQPPPTIGAANVTSPGGPASGGLQASNLLNPNVSVVGWFQGEAGHRAPRPNEESPAALQMKEAEVGFQAVVDPYARADIFASFTGDGHVGLEEGYLTWFHLPADLGLKIGKFRPDFGKFNRIHIPETPFADRPLVAEHYFGTEGLSGSGGDLTWNIPNPWVFLSLDAEITTPPASSDSPAFDQGEHKDLLYVGRLGGYYDLTEAMNVSIGGDYAYGPSSQDFHAVSNSSDTLHSRVYGTDVTLRWKNPRRSIYRSVIWQTEALWDSREAAGPSSVQSHGFFSYLEYQFAQRWRTGVRYDWSQFPNDGSIHEEGGLIQLTFYPSEFNLISLQGKQVKRSDGTTEDLGFLKVTFSMGPHGAHPF